MHSLRRAFRTVGFALAFSAPTLGALAQQQTPIGVPECDTFIARHDQCLSSNVPAANRAQLRASVDQMRDAWRQAAQNPQARAALGPQCMQMSQSMSQSMSAYGCRF